MAWQNFDLTNVSTQTEVIPAKAYTFELAPGAKYDDRGSLQVSATIVNDGEFTGKRVFFSYPDPEGFSREGKPMAWSATALKRLLEALGSEQEPGEDPVSTLNRVAGNRFASSIKHSTPTDQYPTVRAELAIFNVKPAA